MLIDGKNAKNIGPPICGRTFQWVMQDVFLFSNTISDNIALEIRWADENFIRQMAVVADADTFISRMPQGL